MGLIIASALVLGVTIVYTSLLRLKSRITFLISIYLVGFSVLVISFEVASLVKQMNRAGIVAILSFIGILGVLVWNLRGRPSLLGPFQGVSFEKLKGEFGSAFSLLVGSKDLFILLCFICITFGVNLLMSIAVRPANYDVLSYHLPRIIYWFQNQSFLPWTTFDLRQTASPPNGEIGLLWIFLWTKTDAFLWLVQFTSFIFSMIGMAKLAHLLGYPLRSIFFLIFIWATLGQVFYQAFSLQNDLVIACVSLCMVALFFDGIRSGNKGALILSAIAFGLALGTKLTFLFLLPAWGILIALLFWKRPNYRRDIFYWAGASLVAFVLLGAYFYVQNYVYYGSLFGPQETVALISGKNDLFYRLELLRDNLGRYLYQSIEFSPLPDVVRVPLVHLKNNIFSSLYDYIGIAVTSNRTSLNNCRSFKFETFIKYLYPAHPEDTAWFGPLFILFIPVFLARTYKAIRSRNMMQLSLIFLFISYFITQAAIQPWTHYKSRYFITAVALVFPFFADIFRFTTKKHLFRVGQYIVVLIAIVVLLFGYLAQPYRNVSDLAYLLRGERMPPIWYRVPIYLAVDKYVPDDALLGTYYSEFFSGFEDQADELSYPRAGDYPLFGPSFQRIVIPLESLERTPDNIDYLFVASKYAANSSTVQDDFVLLEEHGKFSLYIRAGKANFDNP